MDLSINHGKMRQRSILSYIIHTAHSIKKQHASSQNGMLERHCCPMTTHHGLQKYFVSSVNVQTLSLNTSTDNDY